MGVVFTRVTDDGSLASTKMHSSRCIKSSCVPEPSQFFPFDEGDIVVFVVAIDLLVVRLIMIELLL